MQKPIISPFLEEFDAQEFLPYLLRKEPESDARRECERKHASQDICLFFNYSRQSFSVTSLVEGEYLRKLWKKPIDISVMSADERAVLEILSQKKLIIEEQDAFRFISPELAGIEINSHCNYRCKYCPVSLDPLPNALMPLEVYLLTLERYREAGINSICLNHYGEPTLHPELADRIQAAHDCGFSIVLFTNASHLSADLSLQLAFYERLSIIVNLPTINSEDFYRITGQLCLDRVVENLKYAHQIGLHISVVMNLPRNTTKETENRLRRDFRRQIGLSLVINKSLSSRGGILERSEYISGIKHEGKLNGCLRSKTTNHQGKVFLCCHDYRQKYIFGDIRLSNIEEMLATSNSIQLHRWIFGLDEAPADFICRLCEETSSQSPDTISIGRQKNHADKLMEFSRIMSLTEKVSFAFP